MDDTSNRTAPQGAPGTGYGLLILGAAAAVTAASVLRLAPRGSIVRFFLGHPALFHQLAGVAVLPALVFGALDYRRARAREYVPPSLRVRIARSVVYGSLLANANVLFFLGFRPDLAVLCGKHGSTALFAASPLAALYAVGAFFAVLARREFVVAELPSFQEAALALRESYDFILGRSGSDWKTGTGDPYWFVIPEFGMYANLYCLGGIGSGKTSSVAYPFIEQALFKFPGEPGKRVGLFMLDAKGDNAERLLERARAAGREQDVIVLKPGGEWSYNPLAHGSPTASANKLVAALEVMTDQESNSYYKKMQREFSENALQVLSDVLGQGRVSMMDLYDFICDPKTQAKYLKAAAATNSISYRWFVNQWAREDPREQMMLTKGFRADLSSFVRDEMAPTFATPNATFPGWEQIIDGGKLVIFSMSLDEYGDFARAMGIFVLMDFQSMMLARTTTKFRAAGHNTERLVLCVIDEAWAYMNPKLAEFTSVSRQARCCTIALHQSLGQIRQEAMRQVMLGNLRTPIILSVNDLLTLNTFTQLFGTYKATRRSVSESSGYAGVQQQVLSDRYNARFGGESKSISVSHMEVDQPRFTTDEILHLPQNRAVVQMYDGRNTHTPTVVETLPFHAEGGVHRLG